MTNLAADRQAFCSICSRTCLKLPNSRPGHTLVDSDDAAEILEKTSQQKWINVVTGLTMQGGMMTTAAQTQLWMSYFNQDTAAFAAHQAKMFTAFQGLNMLSASPVFGLCTPLTVSWFSSSSHGRPMRHDRTSSCCAWSNRSVHCSQSWRYLGNHETACYDRI